MTTETLNAVQPYSEVRAAIAAMKTESAGLTFDYETPKGNKLARSHVASLRTYKGDVERKRKELKADALEYGKKVDAVAKELTGEIEAMIDIHQGPLELIASREESRVAKHQANVDALTLIPGTESPSLTSAACRALLQRINDVVVDDRWEEFKTAGLEAQATTRRALEALLTKLLKSEAEAEELARLRAEQIKRESEEAARITAEAQAKREAALMQAASAKAAREAADAAMSAARAKEAETERAINAEREKTRIAELAVAKAKQEKAEAESKAARDEQAKREAEAKRGANMKHRAKILFDALEGLTRYGVDEPSAKLAIEAIAAGKIPHVTIQF